MWVSGFGIEVWGLYGVPFRAANVRDFLILCRWSAEVGSNNWPSQSMYRLVSRACVESVSLPEMLPDERENREIRKHNGSGPCSSHRL